jgi:hypothetical protein
VQAAVVVIVRHDLQVQIETHHMRLGQHGAEFQRDIGYLFRSKEFEAALEGVFKQALSDDDAVVNHPHHTDAPGSGGARFRDTAESALLALGYVLQRMATLKHQYSLLGYNRDIETEEGKVRCSPNSVFTFRALLRSAT